MISITNLTFRYDNRCVFKNATFCLSPNTLCIGKNGSGKTTLLRLIAGILTPETGSIAIDNRFDFKAVFMSGAQILMDDFSIDAHFKWLKSAFHLDENDCCEQIRRFSLSSWMNKTPSALSDGEKQWTALALMTLTPADVYLLDEPVRSLDPEKCSEFYAILDEMAQAGKKIIVTAHQDTPLSSSFQRCSIEFMRLGVSS